MCNAVSKMKAVLLLLAVSACFAPMHSTLDDCFLPLGMEHGHISDEDITASSAFDFKSVGPQNARFRQDKFGGAWCPRSSIGPNVREWIEIDLRRPFRITRTGTQGRFGQGKGQEYAEQFILEYWRKELDGWRTYQNLSGHEILEGNSNTYHEQTNDLVPSVVASKVRFVPQAPHPRTVCMRVELFGCPFEEKAPISYKAPPGDEISPRVFLADVYDGDIEEGNGLGVLTDGQLGQPIQFSEHGISRAPGWVGWQNRNRPVELEFQFETQRNFISVTFTCYSNVDFGIQPLSQILAYFGDSSDSYHENKYVKASAASSKRPHTGTHSITLSLQKSGKSEKVSVGRFLKLQLYFADKWILLSEAALDTTAFEVDPEVIANISVIATNEDYSSNSQKNDAPEGDDNDEENEEDGDEGGEDDDDETPTRENDSQKKEKNLVVISNEPSDSSLQQQQHRPDDEGSQTNGNNQVYVGLVIGVLAVTVILLLATIGVMLRRNKQKVFTKNSHIFKSPERRQPHRLGLMGGSPSELTVPLNTKIYEEAIQLSACGGEDSSPASYHPLHAHLSRHAHLYNNNGGIYHEPSGGGDDYRLCLRGLQPQPQPPQTFGRKNVGSCGRLCDYDEPSLVFNAAQRRLPAKNKFGSTPLFTVQQQQQQQQPHQVGNAGTFVPPSFSCHEVKRNGGGDFTMDGSCNKFRPLPAKPSTTLSSENFYAATDIFAPVEDHPMYDDNVLFPLALNPENVSTVFIPESKGSSEVSQIPQFPRNHLRLIEKLGEGGFGMVHLCEAENWPRLLSLSSSSSSEASSSQESSMGKTAKGQNGGNDDVSTKPNAISNTQVVVRSLWKGSSDKRKEEFLTFACRLSAVTGHSNVASVIAICTQSEPFCVLTQYASNGDLCHFLKIRQDKNSQEANDAGSHYSNLLGEDTISTGSLLLMASQVAEGMKHLEAQGVIHRDLAARNCLVGADCHVKISDFSVHRPCYAADYHSVQEAGKQLLLPLRWVPWEVYIMRDWSSKSDAWSFGILLWEMFTLCATRPLSQLSDQQVEENLTHHYHADGFHVAPPRPLRCPSEIHALMATCWNREPEERPNFREISKVLQELSANFNQESMAF